MKFELLVIAIFTTLASLPTISFAAGDHAVRGHVTKKGTFVAPTRATNPNKTQTDNYGSKPNINPVTGKQGKRIPKK